MIRQCGSRTPAIACQAKPVSESSMESAAAPDRVAALDAGDAATHSNETIEAIIVTEIEHVRSA